MPLPIKVAEYAIEAAWALGAFVFHNRYPESIASDAEPHPYWISAADRAAAEAVLTQLLTDTNQYVQKRASTYHTISASEGGSRL